jgi:hypothetical protein
LNLLLLHDLTQGTTRWLLLHEARRRGHHSRRLLL